MRRSIYFDINDPNYNDLRNKYSEILILLVIAKVASACINIPISLFGR